jgi:hypothetical protein
LVGPFIDNNREATEFKQLRFADLPAVTSCATTEQLHTAIEAALNIPSERRQAFRQALGEEFKARQGASQKLVAHLAQDGLLL